MRRRPADPGLRPRGRFAMGWCRACGDAFTIDRALEPWARARTCSDSCRAVFGNVGRRPTSCNHCVMVESYQLERERQEIAVENEWCRDESASLVVFADWLRHYPWPRDADVLAS